MGSPCSLSSADFSSPPCSSRRRTLSQGSAYGIFICVVGFGSCLRRPRIWRSLWLPSWPASQYSGVVGLSSIFQKLFQRRFIKTDGPFLGLSVEEQFYFLWPAILVFLPGRRRLATCLFLVALAPVWRHIATKLAAGGPLHGGRLDLIYDGLLIGALLAQIQRLCWFRQLFDRIPLPGLLLILSSVGFLYLGPFGVLGVISRPTIQLTCAAVTLKILIESRSAAATWLFELPMVTARPDQLQPLSLAHAVRASVEDFPGHILVRLILSLAAAWVSYRFIEQPMLRLRQRKP